MERTERFYRIDRLLRERRAVPLALFLERLEVSRATFKRDLEYLRDRFSAPIVFDREAGGYRYDEADGAARFELPGLWFSAGELHALATLEQLIEGLQPGLLAPHIEPLKQRLQAMLGASAADAETVAHRVRLIGLGQRRVEPAHFEVLSGALFGRRRLRLRHYNRAEDRHTERTVSPQRLVHYRENWYLDAWCHLRDGLRSFAVDAVEEAEALDEPAREVPDSELDAHFAGGYGIFTGEPTEVARLRFTPERARWVAAELWHPEQQATWLGDGSYRLEVPYSDDRELVMDVLKHGPGVEVEGPDALRRRVRLLLEAALHNYA
ncbi:MAG: WYL domain-containing protein [Gammaproteobacteria bacterium]|nr:WYL domain-containing protein [Gammaproteobacteria bacterium]